MNERSVLVLGGTRSGKSRFALARAGADGADAVTFIATARPGDPELDARIAGHVRERPARWTTIDASWDLAATICAVDPTHVLLLDSLTLWVSAVMDEGRSPADLWTGAEAALAERPRLTVLVSDEVGLGIVPASPLGRQFRDELGILNQRVAACADSVYLMVAGIPLRLKP